MQQKGLFAAILCGALCLTGCLKNVESDSVAEVRKGHAQQLISQAKLNEAQAEAETIKAKAEATIAAAQAQLLEAQAAIAEAEALRITVQAELDAVNVEIAKVKLESEKVKLQEQKARLEQTLAEVDAAIAKANWAKQEALNLLAKAQKQAEIDQVNMQKTLINAEKELLAQMKALDDKKKEILENAWLVYKYAIEKYYEANADLLKAQVNLARMKEDILNGLYIKSEELAKYEQRIANLEAEIEYLESYKDYSYEELSAAYGTAMVALEEALTKKALAEEKSSLAESDYYGLESYLIPADNSDNLAYIYGWKENFINFLQEEVEFVTTTDENGVNLIGVEVPQEGALPKFVPLFTGTIDYTPWTWWTGGSVVPFYGDVEYEETGEIYPAVEDGIISAYAVPLFKADFIPGHIFSENIIAILDVQKEKAADDAKTEKDNLDKAYDEVKNGYLNEEDEAVPGIVEEIATWQARYDAIKKYVDAAEKEFEPKTAAIAPAEAEYKTAQEATRAAGVAIAAHFTGDTRVAEYEDAKGVAENAQRDLFAARMNARFNRMLVRRLTAALNGKADLDPEDKKAEWEDFDDDDVDGDAIYDAYEDFFEEEGLLTKQAIVDAAVTAQQAVVDTYKAKVTTAIVQALENAKGDFEKQIKEVIPAAQEKERKAWNEMQAAYEAYVINENETTKAAYAEKKAAYYGTSTEGTVLTKGALVELQEAIAQVNENEVEGKKTLKKLYAEAKEAYDVVNDPYEEQVEILEFIQKAKEIIDAQVKEVQEALTAAQDALTIAKAEVESAMTAYEEAKTAAEAAYAKVAWIFEPETYDPELTEEEVALFTNYGSALKNEFAARNALVAARNEEARIKAAYKMYDAYKEQLNPELATLSSRDSWASNDDWGWHEPIYSRRSADPSVAQRLADAKNHLLIVEEAYKVMSEGIENELKETNEGIDDVKAALAAYDTYKADYVAFGEEIIEAYDVTVAATKEEIDAQIAVDEAEYAKTFIGYMFTRTIYVMDKGFDDEGKPIYSAYTVAGVDSLIDYIKTGKIDGVRDPEFVSIEDCEKKIAELEDQIAKNFADKNHSAKQLAELNAEIEALMAKIEVYSALADIYAAQITAITGTEEVE